MPLAEGATEAFYPGEIEARNDERNRREGVLLSEDTVAGLEKIGVKLV